MQNTNLLAAFKLWTNQIVKRQLSNTTSWRIAAILGLLVRTVFHDHAIYAIVLGGVAMIIAAVLMYFVKDKKGI